MWTNFSSTIIPAPRPILFCLINIWLTSWIEAHFVILVVKSEYTYSVICFFFAFLLFTKKNKTNSFCLFFGRIYRPQICLGIDHLFTIELHAYMSTYYLAWFFSTSTFNLLSWFHLFQRTSLNLHKFTHWMQKCVFALEFVLCVMWSKLIRWNDRKK